MGGVGMDNDGVEVTYTKNHKSHLVWPEDEDVSLEPMTNLYHNPSPDLVVRKRQLFASVVYPGTMFSSGNVGKSQLLIHMKIMLTYNV